VAVKELSLVIDGFKPLAVIITRSCNLGKRKVGTMKRKSEK